jgi:hypothetical protein
MELKGNGVVVQVKAAEQSSDWLLGAAKEIADAASERGLELFFGAGVAAVESATQEPETVIAPPTNTKESLAEQLISATKGYCAVSEALNAGRRKKDVLDVASDETIAAEFEAWFSEDKLAYVSAAQEVDPEVIFTLVATPNVAVDHKELAEAAKAFGENQPYETYVWDPLYSKYTPEQLSGTDPSDGNSVVFSLIPSKYTPEMNGTAAEQRGKLTKLQASNPNLKVPSPLEAVTYWQTLRAQGDQLADGTTFDKTYIRHFDLPEQRFGGWLGVPDSYVGDDGGPGLDYSFARDDGHARVAVG